MSNRFLSHLICYRNGAFRLGIMPESLIQKESIRRYFTESLAYYSGNELIAEQEDFGQRAG
jgi:hypothetical protein